MNETSQDNPGKVLTPRLRRLLWWILAAFGVMVADSLYLLCIRVAYWATSIDQETLLAIWAFLLHVILGLLLVVPVVVYGICHMLRARRSPNRNARRVGYVLFGTALVLLVSGIFLLRIEGVPNPFESGDANDLVWWIHVLSPLVLVWLFIAHRMVGPRIRWSVGVRWLAATGCILVAAFLVHVGLGDSTRDEYRHVGLPGATSMVAGVDFLSIEDLTSIEGCIDCHPGVHAGWSNSAHRFSSFDNPVYTAAVRRTRANEPEMSTFCAGCHDPVLIATNRFADPRLDDPSIHADDIPGATAGVNCLVCHSITGTTPEGNGSWVLEKPRRYPFHDSDSTIGRWLNRQLIRSRPALHRKSVSTPGVTDSAQLCGTCHKAWLPEGLNHYRWLHGQDHYDSWRLSGVSGHGVDAWRWPEDPQTDCNGCHMGRITSDGMSARIHGEDTVATVRDHLFAAGNTAIATLLDLPDRKGILEAHEKILEESMRVDIVGLREGGMISGAFIGPIRPGIPRIEPGGTYLVEVVCRNTGTGHAFTQGTTDSNEIWLDVTVRDDSGVIGRSGARAEDGSVDPWAYRLNTFTIDAEGRRIQNREPEAIFTNVYDHQVPPGAARVVHYRLRVPENARGPVEIQVDLNYRKFDLALMQDVFGEKDGRAVVQELPIVTVASDRARLRLEGEAYGALDESSPIPEWERMYDYGIGLYLTGKRGSLLQATEAFERVESLGRLEGAFGLARTYMLQGRLDEAVEALQRAAVEGSTVPPWGVTYLSGVLDLDRGLLAPAHERFTALARMQASHFPMATARGFDFSGDDALLLDLAEVELRLARTGKVDGYTEALASIDSVLARNPQSARAWWLRTQALRESGAGSEEVSEARLNHERFRPDDQSAERAVRAARSRYPWADHAAEPSAIYDLHRSLSRIE